MRPYFISSSGTGIGKTLVTAALCHQLRQRGKNVHAIKPVISGYDPGDAESDTALLLRSLGLPPDRAETISPWRYRVPLAPNMAAAREGNPIDMAALLAFCRAQAALPGDVLLAEGVGGVMAPLTDAHTVLDWMVALDWPVVLVVGSYLGAISHALTALETLRTRSLDVRAIVISESPHNGVTLTDTAATLETFAGKAVPVLQIARLNEYEPWKNVPPMAQLCDA